MKTKRLLYVLPMLLLATALTVVACGADDEPPPVPTATQTPPLTAATQKPAAEPAPTPRTEAVVPADPKQYSAPPKMTIDTSKSYTATFKMVGGDEIVAELYAEEAPITVNSFVFLARDGFYDGVVFHRVIPGFMAQGGDPTGTGGGGPGYTFENEFSPIRRHDSPGILSMANSGIRGGKASNGSQFFIMYTIDSPRLDGLNEDGSPKDCTARGVSCHSVFGKVIEGMEVANSLTSGAVIATVAIAESE